MLRFVTVVLLGLATSGFADIQWTRDKVLGLHMELVDSRHIETYSFDKSGSVAVDIGTKKQVTPQLIEETISTPSWYWKIHNGRLLLSDGSSIRQGLTLLDMGHGLITVRRRSGEIARFRYCFNCPKT